MNLEKQLWMGRGWFSYHVGQCLLTSLAWCWVAPLLVALFVGVSESEAEIAFLTFTIGSLVAFVVSTMFSLVAYPLLQYALSPLLRLSKSGLEAWGMVVSLQQVLLYVLVFLILEKELDHLLSENILIWAWILFQSHAAWHLHRYMRHMWNTWRGLSLEEAS